MMPTLVGYNANDPRSREAALAFGTPVIWGHPIIAPGRTVSFATDQNIPWLYTEARGGGRVDPTDLSLFREGVYNMFRYLEILPRRPSNTTEVKWHLFGDGNTDEGLTASHRGFCIPTVETMQDVRQGEELGRICNLLGETLQTFRAPCDGIVVMVRKYPIVEPGEPLFLITGLMT
jgi:predicted deacylase